MANPWVERVRARDPEKYDAAREALRNDPASSWVRYAHGDLDYALYLQSANHYCTRLVGIGIFDIGDYLWADNYEVGTPTQQVVREALENDDLYGPLMAQLNLREAAGE